MRAWIGNWKTLDVLVVYMTRWSELRPADLRRPNYMWSNHVECEKLHMVAIIVVAIIVIVIVITIAITIAVIIVVAIAIVVVAIVVVIVIIIIVFVREEGVKNG